MNTIWKVRTPEDVRVINPCMVAIDADVEHAVREAETGKKVSLFVPAGTLRAKYYRRTVYQGRLVREGERTFRIDPDGVKMIILAAGVDAIILVNEEGRTVAPRVRAETFRTTAGDWSIVEGDVGAVFLEYPPRRHVGRFIVVTRCGVDEEVEPATRVVWLEDVVRGRLLDGEMLVWREYAPDGSSGEEWQARWQAGERYRWVNGDIRQGLGTITREVWQYNHRNIYRQDVYRFKDLLDHIENVAPITHWQPARR